MRGRYTGSVTTTFDPPVGAVYFGAEFDLPAGREQSFLQHGHVEPADKAAKELYAKMNAPVAESTNESAPSATEK